MIPESSIGNEGGLPLNPKKELPKANVKVTINQDVVTQAKDKGLNISAIAQEALEKALNPEVEKKASINQQNCLICKGNVHDEAKFVTWGNEGRIHKECFLATNATELRKLGLTTITGQPKGERAEA